MGNVDFAHRLVMKASLSTSISLPSQQHLDLKLITSLIVNACRVWNKCINGNEIINRFAKQRHDDSDAFSIRNCVRQLLQRQQLNVF